MKSKWYLALILGATSALASPKPTFVCENSASRIEIFGAAAEGERGTAHLRTNQPPSQGGSGAFEATYDVVRKSGERFGRRGPIGTYTAFFAPQLVEGTVTPRLFGLTVTFNREGRRTNEFVTARKKTAPYETVAYAGVTCTPTLEAPAAPATTGEPVEDEPRSATGGSGVNRIELFGGSSDRGTVSIFLHADATNAALKELFDAFKAGGAAKFEGTPGWGRYQLRKHDFSVDSLTTELSASAPEIYPPRGILMSAPPDEFSLTLNRDVSPRGEATLRIYQESFVHELVEVLSRGGLAVTTNRRGTHVVGKYVECSANFFLHKDRRRVTFCEFRIP